MSLLSTQPPFFIFSKTPTKSPLHNHNYHHYNSFSLLPSSTHPLSSSSFRTFFSAPKFTITSDGDDDEWGQDSKSKPKPKPKSKPTSSSNPKSNSFTVGPPGLNVSVNIPGLWGENSGPKPDPDVDDEWGQEPEPESKPIFSVGAPGLNVSVTVPDEWGEKSGPDPEPESKFTGPDPPIREDEDSWGPLIPSVGDVKSAIGGVEKAIDNVNDGVAKAVDSGKDGVEKAIDNVNEGVEKAIDEVNDGVAKAVDSGKGGFEKAVDSVDDGMAKATDSIKGGVDKAIDDVEGGVGKAVDRVEDGVVKAVDGVEGGVEKAIDDVEGGVGRVIDGIEGGFSKEAKKLELKRALLDSLYGSELGFRASAEVRAEVSELVSQLEALNPNPNPTEVPGLLDGKWVLVYTAFSELLPLLAVGSTPLLKVQQISQSINTMNQTVENSTILFSPFLTFSFSATASFDVRSSSRIQVQFKEATFKPPEIKSQFDIPTNINVFGQNITLSPVQQLLNPVQEAAASISRGLYGLPPLKISIPGERTASWLLFTYVDVDFRISRGDGGIFVLVREGSPLLNLM